MHLRTRAVHALPYGMDERDATFRKEVEGSCIHAIPKTRRSIQTDLRMASKTTNIAEGGMQPEITKWPLRFSWNYNPRYLRLYGAGSAAVRGGPQTPENGTNQKTAPRNPKGLRTNAELNKRDSF